MFFIYQVECGQMSFDVISGPYSLTWKFAVVVVAFDLLKLSMSQAFPWGYGKHIIGGKRSEIIVRIQSCL